MATINYTTGDATDPITEGNKIIVHICNDIGGWGKVLSVDYNSVGLHLVDKYFKWSGSEVIKFSNISYIGFDTQYERKIRKKLRLQ